jgi:predicted MFS family arabinose efflux permease
MIGALVAGQFPTAGRERMLITIPIAATSIAFALLLAPAGLPVVFAAFALIGFLNGPLDVAMFTLRQRRTDPAWMGRAFAISMALNYAGYPLGSLVGGLLAEEALAAAVVFCIGAALAGAAFAWRRLPRA